MAVETYGKLTKVEEIEFPAEVTATFERHDPETGEEFLEVTETRDSLAALVGLHVQLDRSSNLPKKRGRKGSGVDELQESVDEAQAFADGVRAGASVMFKIQSGTSEPEEVLANGACAAFVAYVCDIGSVLRVSLADTGSGMKEAAEIKIMEGRGAGETSRSLETTNEQTEPVDQPEVAVEDSVAADGGEDGEGAE